MKDDCAWKGCEEEGQLRDLRFIAPNGNEIKAVPIPLCDSHLREAKRLNFSGL